MPMRFCPVEVIFTNSSWVPRFSEPNGKGRQAFPLQQRERGG